MSVTVWAKSIYFLLNITVMAIQSPNSSQQVQILGWKNMWLKIDIGVAFNTINILLAS